MSYPRSLDEYSDDELRAELRRRSDSRREGNCSYCGKPALRPGQARTKGDCRYHETLAGIVGTFYMANR